MADKLYGSRRRYGGVRSLLDAQSRRRRVFVAGTLAFDWQFTSAYFHRFVGRNPCDRRVGDFYAGLEKRFGRQRNAEALRRMVNCLA